MLGIGKTWRFSFRNSLAVDLAASGVVISGRLVRFDTAGKQEFSTDSALYTSGAVVNGAFGAGPETDNATEKWIGGDFVAVLVAPAGASGRLDLFYERKVNGQWPTAGLGKLVAQFSVTAAGTYNLDFSL